MRLKPDHKGRGKTREESELSCEGSERSSNYKARALQAADTHRHTQRHTQTYTDPQTTNTDNFDLQLIANKIKTVECTQTSQNMKLVLQTYPKIIELSF